MGRFPEGETHLLFSPHMRMMGEVKYSPVLAKRSRPQTLFDCYAHGRRWTGGERNAALFKLCRWNCKAPTCEEGDVREICGVAVVKHNSNSFHSKHKLNHFFLSSYVREI